MVSEAKGPLLTFIAGVLQWTNAKNAPPWLKKGKRDRESSRLYEWTHELGATLGGISGLVPMAEVRTRFLEPIFGLEGDTCWALLATLVSSYICRYIYDARQVADDAVDVLSLCLERFLKSPSFKRSSYRSGEFYGFDEPRLLKLLMFVSVERADLAARYVNGDWSEIKMILPLVDRFVRAGGWSVSVMSQFLTLCERSKSAYPAEMFADQVLAVLGHRLPVRLYRWHSICKLPGITGKIPMALLGEVVGESSPALIYLAARFNKGAFAGFNSNGALEQFRRDSLGLRADVGGVPAQTRAIDSVLLGLRGFTTHCAPGSGSPNPHD